MSEFGIFAAVITVTYVLPAAACFLWWDYDHVDDLGGDRAWAFMPLVNLVAMVALTWWRIERGSEYGRLKQQLRRERARDDLEALRDRVEPAGPLPGTVLTTPKPGYGRCDND